MRARDAVGRRVVRVAQSQHYDQSRQELVWSIDWLELDNGARIVFHPHDDGSDLFVTADVVA
jgi:hypothetical protein